MMLKITSIQLCDSSNRKLAAAEYLACFKDYQALVLPRDRVTGAMSFLGWSGRAKRGFFSHLGMNERLFQNLMLSIWTF